MIVTWIFHQSALRSTLRKYTVPNVSVRAFLPPPGVCLLVLSNLAIKLELLKLVHALKETGCVCDVTYLN